MTNDNDPPSNPGENELDSSRDPKEGRFNELTVAYGVGFGIGIPFGAAFGIVFGEENRQ